MALLLDASRIVLKMIRVNTYDRERKWERRKNESAGLPGRGSFGARPSWPRAGRVHRPAGSGLRCSFRWTLPLRDPKGPSALLAGGTPAPRSCPQLSGRGSFGARTSRPRAGRIHRPAGSGLRGSFRWTLPLRDPEGPSALLAGEDARTPENQPPSGGRDVRPPITSALRPMLRPGRRGG